MFFLIKLILILAVLSGVFVYGETIWDGIKERVVGVTDPELQRANLLDSFKSNFSEIEEIVRQMNDNIDDPNFDKKARVEKALKLIEESKSGLEKISQSETESTFIEKTFDGFRDVKEGIQTLFQNPQTSKECQCSPGTNN